MVYAFKPAASCTVTVSLCGSTYDTQLAVYERVNDWSSDLTEVSCNDDYCENQSFLQVDDMFFYVTCHENIQLNSIYFTSMLIDG